jgi:ParB-like chromosome segregation protein Spo0J
MTNQTINPQLEPLLVSLDRLEVLDKNPRKGDVAAVAKSYEKFGQRKPIVARITGGTPDEPTGVVIAGNHQFRAAKKLGWTQIAVVWTDDDETTAKAFALADNRTSELGTVDDDLLAENIREILEIDESLIASAGYSQDDVDKLLKDAAEDLDEDTSPQLGDLAYRLMIECNDEQDQASLMETLDGLGIVYQVQVV